MAIICLLLASSSAKADKRVALVIGNGAYRSTNRLVNPPRDARVMAEKLEALGFSVHLGVDLTHTAMETAQQSFIRSLDGADVALMYYAGHGLQVTDRNYMVPIDATLEMETDVDFQAVALSKLVDLMMQRAKVTLVFLDACRNNPLASRMIGRGRKAVMVGLAQERLESGELLIAYATDPGQVAADGTGTHSPFTRALLEHIDTPGLEVQQVMKHVTQSVVAQTEGRQRPWQSATLQHEVFLSGPPSLAAGGPLVPWRPETTGSPLYKRWWLWTAVGVVVAGVAVGLGVGLSAARPDLSGTAVLPFGN